MDTGFGDWLAGLADGEAHFEIGTKGHSSPQCRFVIQLRDDDSATLEYIQRELGGLGSIYFPKSGRIARYMIYSKLDVLALVRVFDAHPLRSKKRHDYSVWRQAVLESQKAHSDKDRLLSLASEIKEVRKYNSH